MSKIAAANCSKTETDYYLSRDAVQETDNPLRALPQVQRLLEEPAAISLCEEFGRSAVTEVLRRTLDNLREQIGSGALQSVPNAQVIVAHLAERLAIRQKR